MFDELQEQIKRAEDATTTPVQRWVRNIAVLLVSAVLFGGLYVAIRFMES